MIPVWTRVTINAFQGMQCENMEGIVLKRCEEGNCIEDTAGTVQRVVTTKYYVRFYTKGCCNNCGVDEAWFCEDDLTILVTNPGG